MGWTTIMKMCKHGARGRCYCYLGETCKRYEAWDSDKIKEENNMNKKELKMGDIVEVAFHCDGVVWNESIFVKYGIDNSIIVVQSSDNTKFLAGEPFDTFKYTSGHWRIPKQKTYRPFKWEEREQLRGKWITRKVERDNPNPEYCITIINNVGIYIGATVTFKALYEDFIFLGGSPVGKLEE